MKLFIYLFLLIPTPMVPTGYHEKKWKKWQQKNAHAPASCAWHITLYKHPHTLEICSRFLQCLKHATESGVSMLWFSLIKTLTWIVISNSFFSHGISRMGEEKNTPAMWAIYPGNDYHLGQIFTCVPIIFWSW
jgi:hypothetical protein